MPMREIRRLVPTAAGLVGLLSFAGESRAQLRISDPERNVVIQIGGQVQPRYEFLGREGAEDLSSFYLRRARVDVQGHLFTERLTFRILPELARTATMRDAYVNYRLRPALDVRFGQFTLPFQWHRFVSASRLHFAERSVPGEEFGFPDARDIGVMVHGRNPAGTFAWGTGIFDGAGRNVMRSTSSGNLVSGRVTGALLGSLPRGESDVSRMPHPDLALGAGIQAANRSDARRWDLGRSPTGRGRGDWVAGTADAVFRWSGFSAAAELYRRRVWPEDPVVTAYHGGGYLVSGGYTVIADRLEAVARYSDLRLDLDDPATRMSQWGVGFNLFHRGHSSQTKIQYLADREPGPSGFVRQGLFLMEYQVVF